MPTNNFKLFDENKANLLTDTEYANATQRLNGVQTGVASSQLNNKFAYQVSLVAYSIAQLMNANGLDASDTLAVSAFVGNLQGALLQKVADKATTAEAAAGVLSNKYITPETMKAAALLLSGGVMNGVLDMGNNRITNLGTPTDSSDAVTKEYVDGKSTDGLFGYTKLCTLTSTGLVSVNMTFEKIHSIIFIANCEVNITNSSDNYIVFRAEDGIAAQFSLFGNNKRNNIVANNLLLVRYPETYGGYSSSSTIYFNEGLVYSSYVSSVIVSVSYQFNLISGTIDIYTKYYN